jgi:hypothetical protein
MKKTFCLLFVAVLAYSPTVFAGVDTTAANTGFQFLDLAPLPRQAAMGFAGTALSGNGSAFYNPASAAFGEQAFLSAGFAPLPGEYSVPFATGSARFSTFFAGASITNNSTGGIIPANEQGISSDPVGSWDGTYLAIHGGVILDKLALAVSFNGLQDRIVSYTAFGLSMNVGAMYKYNENLTFGLAGFQLGTTTSYLDDNKVFGKGYALPRSARFGAAFSDILYKMPFTVTGDIVYRDVGTYTTPYSARFNRITVPVGIELWPTSYVALRLGKRFNYETDIIQMGIGLRYAMLSCDAAVVFSQIVNDLEMKPFVSVTYTLPVKKAEFAPAKKPVIEKPSIREKPVAKPVNQPILIEEETVTVDTAKKTISLDTNKVIIDTVKSSMVKDTAATVVPLEKKQVSKPVEVAPADTAKAVDKK